MEKILDDILVVNLSQQCDLPEGSAWESFALDFKVEFLDGHNLLGILVLGLVDLSVGSLANVCKLGVDIKCALSKPTLHPTYYY